MFGWFIWFVFTIVISLFAGVAFGIGIGETREMNKHNHFIKRY
ncbi:hypothetical protein NVV78_07775 [Pediococcus ethanolidurans]|nr:MULTISPECIES: hypothetical protein [Pediococcus]MCV3315838.1 hypothetical protein [Pediococcus ethanolidurans]MCV3321748.1 hypothetical protein [Pediococcus ethanolidurans]MCV3324541.1 hypothetical protein [Pediococcus ethanolidurans]MCV3327563.1 hypothetical protein [Pediococcus ethanolidurans]MCV3555392.1 hypothetical protein [Pediococcus ethanolidurans]